MSATSGGERREREGGAPPPAEAEEGEVVVEVKVAKEETDLVRKGSSGAEQ
jgi:hypothetical protein